VTECSRIQLNHGIYLCKPRNVGVGSSLWVLWSRRATNYAAQPHCSRTCVKVEKQYQPVIPCQSDIPSAETLSCIFICNNKLSRSLDTTVFISHVVRTIAPTSTGTSRASTIRTLFWLTADTFGEPVYRSTKYTKAVLYSMQVSAGSPRITGMLHV
jgi:hypothetical protein